MPLSPAWRLMKSSSWRGPSSRAATLSHADGVEWEVRVRSKSLRGSGVQVVFQWREERPTDIASSGALLKQNADIYPAVCA